MHGPHFSFPQHLKRSTYDKSKSNIEKWVINLTINIEVREGKLLLYSGVCNTAAGSFGEISVNY